ncbi:MAG: DNA-binding transcriptional regulator [Phycisphaerae bacterium]|nr:DNA-binding transcriptional regulator [Phycisphaerae bacterium]
MPKVLVLIEASREFSRGILSGLALYSKIRGPWMFVMRPPFYVEDTLDSTVISWLDTLTIDGIILQARYITDRIRKSGVPLIAMDANTNLKGIPKILCDDQRIGQMAAEHLLECGFSHFAFCGFDHLTWSQQRCDSLRQTVESAGYPCDIYRQSQQGVAQSWTCEYSSIIDWLAGLPKPLGLMACNDDRGQQILEACKIAGYSVPEEIAVVGADNDQLECALTAPPLSSVSLNLEKAGYQAADAMDKLIQGKKTGDIIVDPIQVVRRQSTDIVAVGDADVSTALRFIREHADKSIQVNDVIQVLCVSRRTLYAKFHKALGRSVHDEIVRVRLARIKSLLTDTQLSISRIAKVMNFTGPDKLFRFFVRETGKTPTEFRKDTVGYKI